MLRICIVITSKVCKDFQKESLLQTFEGAKVFADFRGKSLQTLEVITIQTFLRKFSESDPKWPSSA